MRISDWSSDVCSSDLVPALKADPTLAAPILEALRADPSLYVRKSVANHLNDIAKDRPDWLLARLNGWPQDDARPAWIVRHALRPLNKQVDPIGRAACRERVWQSVSISVVAVCLKKTKQTKR